jgi:hypothetical protein
MMTQINNQFKRILDNLPAIRADTDAARVTFSRSRKT